MRWCKETSKKRSVAGSESAFGAKIHQGPISACIGPESRHCASSQAKARLRGEEAWAQSPEMFLHLGIRCRCKKKHQQELPGGNPGECVP